MRAGQSSAAGRAGNAESTAAVRFSGRGSASPGASGGPTRRTGSSCEVRRAAAGGRAAAAGARYRAADSPGERSRRVHRHQPARPPTPAAANRQARYRCVNPELLHTTICRLEQRLARRFPLAGLREVARELTAISDAAMATSRRISRPIYLLRAPSWVLLIALFTFILLELLIVRRWGDIGSIADFIQVLEATLGTIFFLAALVAFLLSLETRWKRARALDAIHGLRAIAHVVDMHQLTKDPTEPNLGASRMPPDDRPLTPEELVRYLDFCGEMLSLISKLAVLYVQDFPDDVAVNAVDEVETLTNSLNRRIWQKIAMIRHERPEAVPLTV